LNKVEDSWFEIRELKTQSQVVFFVKVNKYETEIPKIWNSKL